MSTRGSNQCYHKTPRHCLAISQDEYCSPPDGVRMLEYRSKPYHYPSNAFLNSTHLSRLLFAYPNIETLVTDLEIKEEWDYNLDTIVSFPKLTRLVLRFEREEADTCNEWSDEYFPYKDEESFYQQRASDALMQGLGAYLRKKKLGGNLKIWRPGWGIQKWKIESCHHLDMNYNPLIPLLI
jgi:hypothetical protein